MISSISKAQVKRGTLLFLLLFVDFYLSIILFDSIVLSSLDTLDGVAVNNKIIGQFYIEGKEVFDIFLNGNISWLYLDRIFNPIILVYTFFKFKSLYPDDTRPKVRANIYLEDWQPGHLIHYQDQDKEWQCSDHWKAGEGFLWDSNHLHLSGNCGLKDKYTLQISGFYLR